jgi:hypothetical protein
MTAAGKMHREKINLGSLAFMTGPPYSFQTIPRSRRLANKAKSQRIEGIEAITICQAGVPGTHQEMGIPGGLRKDSAPRSNERDTLDATKPAHRTPAPLSDSRPQSSEMQPYYSFGNLEKRPRDVKRKIANRDG